MSDMIHTKVCEISGEIVSACSIYDENGIAFVSVDTIESHRRSGHAGTCVKRALEWWDTKSGRTDDLNWFCARENVASRRLAEKSGFAYVGDLESNPRFVHFVYNSFCDWAERRQAWAIT